MGRGAALWFWSSVVPLFYKKGKEKIWRKFELKLGSLFTFENLAIKPSVLYV